MVELWSAFKDSEFGEERVRNVREAEGQRTLTPAPLRIHGDNVTAIAFVEAIILSANNASNAASFFRLARLTIISKDRAKNHLYLEKSKSHTMGT